MAGVETGLDQFEKKFWKRYKGQSLGLLANQASIDHNMQNTKDIIADLLPGQLKIIFGPQHGFRGEDQDNMIETEDYFDPVLRLPVIGLYGNKKGRLSEVIDAIDLLIIDLQDVGTRVYTFISTMLSSLKAAAKAGKRVLILDRPNPVGGVIVEGNILRQEFCSIVGPFPLPMRHGMTMGELANLFNNALKLDCDISIIPLAGWTRDMLWKDTGLSWIMPSPNMPFPETAMVYPGQVIWEGTNISEGRGTCRPFEIFGTPFITPGKVKKVLSSENIQGCYLQEYYFRPTFNKWREELCGGFFIHVFDPALFRPFRTSLFLLKIIIEIHKENFAWRNPPYEYEFQRLPIDLILGDSSIRIDLEAGKDIDEILGDCSEELEEFLELRKPYLLYK
ncbi:MAG TPA: DUF1343 domain-containing protein [Desulfatiglandales bacterium]|nr:DUF1343 domain-containing protein [Desulfatiglandales bacterium]